MDIVSWPKDNSNAITKDHKVCTFDDIVYRFKFKNH